MIEIPRWLENIIPSNVIGLSHNSSRNKRKCANSAGERAREPLYLVVDPGDATQARTDMSVDCFRISL
jgi:hypothetical protein